MAEAVGGGNSTYQNGTADNLRSRWEYTAPRGLQSLGTFDGTTTKWARRGFPNPQARGRARSSRALLGLQSLHASQDHQRTQVINYTQR